MGRSRKRQPLRKRIGKVSYYQRRGGWYVYYRDGNRQVRRRVTGDEQAVAAVAAEINAQLMTGAPTLFAFTPISVAELCTKFVDHHEFVRRSAIGTVQRYRSALRHLRNYVEQRGGPKYAHQVNGDDFVRYVREKRVSPNGHGNSRKRRLADKTACFIIETCRSAYGFAAQRRHLPPYADNPFANLGGKRFSIDDAKPIYVFDAESELAFLEACDDWNFAIQFTLAKTGLRIGELVHLLIEEVDLETGWLHVRNKPELGWRIKTRRERAVPLVSELVSVLKQTIGQRTGGPVFLRQKFDARLQHPLNADHKTLTQEVRRRVEAAEEQSQSALSREAVNKVAHSVWRDMGALVMDRVRNAFIRTAAATGLVDVTCPKSWRHTFATLLQDANVDPLIRQITLGHSPSTFGVGALGMTSIYTHTRPETQQAEIDRAMRRWPRSLELAARRASGGKS